MQTKRLTIYNSHSHVLFFFTLVASFGEIGKGSSCLCLSLSFTIVTIQMDIVLCVYISLSLSLGKIKQPNIRLCVHFIIHAVLAEHFCVHFLLRLVHFFVHSVFLLMILLLVNFERFVFFVVLMIIR